MNQVVGILGGMGPAAGAAFAQSFVNACTERLVELGLAVSDQAYPEHWLVQAPIAERMSALVGAHKTDFAVPLAGMHAALGKLSQLQVASVAIACNTAHAWHAPLQAAYPGLELLHIVRELVVELKHRGMTSVGLLATQGTYATGLYAQELALHGIRCVVPDAQGRETLMRGIFEGVKAGRPELAQACFTTVANALCASAPLDAMVLGCTEIPLGLHALPEHPGVPLVDAAQVLAMALARRAIRQDQTPAPRVR